MRIWRKNNTERTRAHHRSYYIKNSAKIKARIRQRRRDDPVAARARAAASYARHRDSRSAYMKAYRKLRGPELRAQERARRASDRERHNRVANAWKLKNLKKVRANARACYLKNRDRTIANRRLRCMTREGRASVQASPARYKLNKLAIKQGQALMLASELPGKVT